MQLDHVDATVLLTEIAGSSHLGADRGSTDSLVQGVCFLGHCELEVRGLLCILPLHLPVFQAKTRADTSFRKVSCDP